MVMPRIFLIPRKMAVPADDKALKLKTNFEEEERQREKQYQAMADKLAKEPIEFRVKTGPKGEVFGSVKADDIKKSLEVKGYELSEVVLKQPLKALGDYQVGIKLGRSISGRVLVKILPQ